MTKATKRQPKLRADRGHRYRMVLELESDDHDLLKDLVVRYQKLLGPAKSNKVLVIRQLIRSAAKQRDLSVDE